ncbi:hypothetical protein R6Q59_036142, partial [Mikania micrantha]
MTDFLLNAREDKDGSHTVTPEVLFISFSWSTIIVPSNQFPNSSDLSASSQYSFNNVNHR